MSDFQNSDSRLVELKKLGELKEAGLLSDEEFEAEKKRLLIATTEASHSESLDSERYQAGSYKTNSQVEWEKFDRSSLSLLLKRAAWFTLVASIIWVPLALLFPAIAFPLLFLLWLLEIVFAIVSKLIGKRIGLTPILHSWMMQKKEQ
jgi:hypothetical protein